ncbi:MAG TPA: MauE/DoxX family redox-associated membrane protein [bacterium]|nr:MauE/DoxX family redox-associated membrane protein [bacterium]HMW37674.1 MauE/DoxX family redox-associated membrane protein [bacterium]HMY35514.1 MauE/DoxX family redox-associated membrane protein [bacterium]HMZ03262.1 MauE/DoxX family redox-associated membrane protein [bacterium]HNB08616.1 MauE/DoxX family redox-associated membrane protein [bacterium]
MAWKSHIKTALRLILGIVFCYGALDKITSPYAFAAAIDAYRILPAVVTPISAVWLAWLELFIGIALMVGYWTRAAAGWAILLLSIFIFAITSALLRDLVIPCGCFDVNDPDEVISWKKIAEDGVLLMIAVYVFISPYARWSLSKEERLSYDGKLS